MYPSKIGRVALLLPLVSGLGLVGIARADELKVDLNAPGRRDVATPHWENWTWNPGASASQTFGNVTVTLRSSGGETLTPALFKGLLDYQATVACDGVFAPGGEIEIHLAGLAPGRHTLVTYHNQVGDTPPVPLDISVDGGAPVVHNLTPTQRVTSDYDVASAFVPFTVEQGKEVVVRIKAMAGGGCTLNGFEIDTPNPRSKAIKPIPANDDEHADGDAPLTWTPPSSAVAHQIYFGTSAEAVARATPASPEYKGKLQTASFRLPKLDPMGTYFWRVDEASADAPNAPTRGEVWRFQPRSLAFPTAEGYGRWARGGRGGRVIEVTTLEDYDFAKGEAVIPGSYRAAVEAEGPRTVVFRVSGVIRLKRPCAVSKPYCTVAGQTAPGDGICLANYSAGAFGTHDVIIRYMRFRIGDAAKKAMDGAGLGSCNHCIMDHCSISWSSDEGTSSRSGKNITFQHNLVAEALHHSYHYRASDRTKFETHAFAGSISGNIGSYHHNLLAHCTDRNWSLAGGYNQSGQYDGILDIRNNVVYNWTARTTDGGVMQLNYVNNYYKPNPQNPFVKWLLKLDPIQTVHGTPRYYMSGNIMEGFDYESDNWKAFQGSPEEQKLVRSDVPLFEPYVRTETAQQAFTSVLADVGANLPRQDVIDRRIIEEARTGTTHYTGTRGPTFDPPSRNFAGIIDAPTDDKDAMGSPDFPWPQYRTYDVPTDSDHDGMPDDWERAHGLNPKDPADGARLAGGGSGYTKLELYLNSIQAKKP